MPKSRLLSKTRQNLLTRQKRTDNDSQATWIPLNKFGLVIFSLLMIWYMWLYRMEWSSLTDQTPLSSNRVSSSNSTNVLDIDLKSIIRSSNDAVNVANPCTGRYIYVHDLPRKFNDDLIQQCRLLNKWNDMCPYLANFGFGPDLGNPQRIFLESGWYVTNQFSLELIFHNRMKEYECLTMDSSDAAAIYVPFYAGLDVARHLWGSSNVSVRDADSLAVVNWLREKPEWKSLGGMDHFMVAGRITWDFRRGVDENSAWGNKLMLLPEAKNMTILTIESSPWSRNDFAIPYPTYFHPSSDGEVFEWQNKVRKVRRKTLFSFVGGGRPNMEGSIRSEIMEQCVASGSKCRLLECIDKNSKCVRPVYVMKMFQNSVFCLQPPGDSFTRRSTFDSILAGCIPVFFHPASAYVQYVWHLPKDYRRYSVFISESDIKEKKVRIEDVLSRIHRSKVFKIREEVIRLIPKVVYADPRSRMLKNDDAFDLAVKAVIERIGTLRKEMNEGINQSFDEEMSWKYNAFGTVENHQWDSFLVRGHNAKQ